MDGCGTFSLVWTFFCEKPSDFVGRDRGYPAFAQDLEIARVDPVVGPPSRLPAETRKLLHGEKRLGVDETFVRFKIGHNCLAKGLSVGLTYRPVG
jgi:hypothetical protein